MTPEHLYLLAMLKDRHTMTVGHNSPYYLELFAALVQAGMVSEISRNDYGVTFKAI